LEVQGRSRSSMLVPLESSSAVLVVIRSKSVSICNRSRARRVHSSKITISYAVPLLTPSFEGNLLTRQREIRSPQTRDSMPSYGENPESLSHLGLNRYRVMTDRITTASTRLALRIVS